MSLTGFASLTRDLSQNKLSSCSSRRGLKLNETALSKSLSFHEPIERVSFLSLENLERKTGKVSKLTALK